MCECERAQSSSLAQSLHLMNAADVKEKLSASGGRAERLAADGKPVAGKIRELYLAAFAREPQSYELAAAEDYLAKHREDGPRPVFEDLLWALLNTKEFRYNH